MIKKIFLLFCLFIALPLWAASPSARINWWQSRIDKLKSQREAHADDSSYHLVAPLVESDIEKSEELISYIDKTFSETTGAELLSGDDRHFIDTVVEENFKLYYLSFLMGELEDPVLRQKSRTILDDGLRSLVKNYTPDATEQEITSLTDRALNARIERSFTYEFILESGMKLEEKYKSSFLQRANKSIDQKLTENTLTYDELLDILVATGQAVSASWQTEEMDLYPELITRTVQWHDLDDAIGSRAHQEKAIKEFLTLQHVDDGKGALYYREYPAKLEAKLFGQQRSSGSWDEKMSLAKISVDRNRKLILARLADDVSVYTDAQIENNLMNGVEETIKKYTLAGTDAQLLRNYAALNSAYLLLVKENKTVSSPVAEKLVTYRLEKYESYAKYLKKLYRASLPETGCTFHVADSDLFVSNSSFVKQHLKFLGYGAAILPSYQKIISSERLPQLSSQQRGVRMEISNLKNDCTDIYNDYIAYQHELAKNSKERFNSSMEELARVELDFLAERIEICLEEYKNFDYDRMFLDSYLALQLKLDEKVSAGIIPEEMDTVNKEHSLISLTDHNNIEQLQNEKNAKAILRELITSDSVRYSKLADYYKSQGISGIGKDSDYVYTVLASLKKISEVKLYDWKMNTDNYPEIDARVVKTLLLKEKKKLYTIRKETGKTGIDNDVHYSDDMLSISFYVPKGWDPLTRINGNSKYERTFVNNYDGSVLRITSIKDGESEKSALNKWMEEHDLQKIQFGWKNEDNRLCLWQVAKDAKGNVIRAYAFKQGDDIIIVSGLTSKKRYPFFYRRVDTLFNSVQAYN